MKRIVSLFLIVCLLASAIPALSLEVNAFDPEITGIGLYVDAPQVGKALPETAEIPSGYEGYYVADVSWYPQHSTFQAGETYCVTATVEAEDDYYFSTTDMLTYINEQKATVLSKSADQYKISLEFQPLTADADFIETTYTYEGQPITKLEVLLNHPLEIQVVCDLPQGATNVKYQWYIGNTPAQWGEPIFNAVRDTIQVFADEVGTLYYRCQVTAEVNGQLISSPSEEFNTVEVTVHNRGLPSMFFDDVNLSHWFYHDVEFVYYNEFMNGTGNNKFSPYGTLTRAMLVTILYRLDGRPSIHSANPFRDVPDGEYYEKPVIWAYENNIVQGVGDGLFAPNQPITREQIATIFCRYAKYTGEFSKNDCTALTGFADAGKVSPWAQESMCWAVGVGLINGIETASGLYLQPQGNAQRCQAAAILHRYVDIFIPAFD